MSTAQTAPKSILSQIERLSSESLIPKLPFHPQDKQFSELRAYFTQYHSSHDSQIFINTSKRSENLKAIQDLVKHEDFDGIGKAKEWAAVFLFLGEQHDGSNEWSSPENAILVLDILKEIRTHCLKKYTNDKHGENLEGLFTQDFEKVLTISKTIFHSILGSVKMKMRLEEWRYYPGAVTSFRWILLQIKYPYLSEFVDDVLPPSLLLTDDYTKTYKLIGLECIIHCIDNVNKAELLRNNWALVIFDALNKLIHDKETDVINNLSPTLLKILGAIEDNPNECSDKITKYDETVKKIIFAMEFSSDLNQKKAWLPHLVAFIQNMGHGSLHWVDRISSMLLEYTTCNDYSLWIAILKCVGACIQNTWLKPSSEAFAEILLRIVFNASVFTDKEDDTETDKDEIYEQVRFCFELLSYCEDFEDTKVQLQEILNSPMDKQLNPQFLKELNKYDLIK